MDIEEMLSTTAPITVAGHTQTVAIYCYADNWDNGGWTREIFTATIGRGKARYPASIRLFPLAPDKKPSPGCRETVAANGIRFQYHLSTCIRNRQATINGWREREGITNKVSQERTKN